MCAYLTKDGLETLLTKIKNQFVEIGEKNKYSGIVASTIPDNGGVSSIGNPTNNYIYKVSGSEIYLEPNSGSKQYYLYNKFTSPKKCNFYFPENSYIKYQEDLFSLSTTTTGGKTYKKLTPNIELDYYAIEVAQYASNRAVDAYIIEIDCSYSTDNCYVEIEKSSLGTKFVNTSWFNTYKDYVSKITYYNNSTYVNLSKNLTTNMVDGVDNLWGSYTKMRIHFNPGLKSFSGMFEGCHIKNISLIRKPSSVVDFSYMFMDSTLESCVDLDPIDMPAYSNCKGMFKNCINLKNIFAEKTNPNIVSNDNTNFLLKFNWLGDAIWDSMFEGCINMRYIDLMDWEVVGNSTIMADRMFYNTNKTSFNISESDLQYNTIVLPHTSNNKPYIDSAENMFAGCDYLSYIYTKFVKLTEIYSEDGAYIIYDPIRGQIDHPSGGSKIVEQYLNPDELDESNKTYLDSAINEYGESRREIIWPGVVFTKKAERQNIMGDVLSINFSRANNGKLLSKNNYLTLTESGSPTCFSLKTDDGSLETFNTNRAGSMGYISLNATVLRGLISSSFKFHKHTMLISPYYNTDNYYHNDREEAFSGSDKFVFIYVWVRPDLSMYMQADVNVESYCNNLISIYRKFYSDSIIEN